VTNSAPEVADARDIHAATGKSLADGVDVIDDEV
jgi:hypothetical protein